MTARREPSRKQPGRAARSSTEEVTIESIAAGGAGVAHLADGRAVFVPRSAPGDRVSIDVDISRSPAQGRILRVLTPSPERVEAPCAWVDACGGCDLMHLSQSGQERAHVDVVRRAIEHATGARLAEPRVHRAPAVLAYRTRARLSARVERGVLRVGYREAGSRDVVAVDCCAVLAPALAPILGELRDVLAGSRGEGDAQVALGEADRRVVELTWRGELGSTTWARIDALVAAGAWAGARVLLEGAATPASFGDPRIRMVAADGAPLVVAPGGFAQPSALGAAMLAQRVAELAELPQGRPRRILELFAGSGTFSVLLARAAESFQAVELDPAAAACARENLAARGLEGKVLGGDADAFAIPPATELVVLDPPRTGAAGAAREIARKRPRQVVYVSCDPATLARDLGVLTRAGLAIASVSLCELFPQTSHAEVLVKLVRAPRG